MNSFVILGLIIKNYRSLLDAKADFNAVTLTGLTPLMMAVEFGHIDAVDLLLAEKSIQVNEADSIGRTALYIAIEEADEYAQLKTEEDIENKVDLLYHVVERLLVAGADPNVIVQIPPPELTEEEKAEQEEKQRQADEETKMTSNSDGLAVIEVALPSTADTSEPKKEGGGVGGLLDSVKLQVGDVPEEDHDNEKTLLELACEKHLSDIVSTSC